MDLPDLNGKRINKELNLVSLIKKKWKVHYNWDFKIYFSIR